MSGEVGLHHAREHGHAILVTLAPAHHDLISGEIDVLDAQAAAFEQAKPGSVQQGSCLNADRSHREARTPLFSVIPVLLGAGAWMRHCPRARFRSSRSMGVIYGCGLSATSGMVTSAMSGGPGVEAHTTLSAARCRARVHRLQYFCRRRVL